MGWVEDHFRTYDAPWAHLNSLEKQISEHPTFVIGEFLFIGLAILALYHALNAEKAGERRLLLVWAATFIWGTLNDYFFMLLPMVDNFWQAQAIIMLTPRMPLYIPCVYNGFMYWSTVAAARIFRYWKKNLVAEAALAGLMGGVLYAPYDVNGARFLWWTWHHGDPAVSLRWFGVPAGSTTWTIVFTFCFVLLLRQGEDWGWDQLQSLALAGLSTPVMMVLMCPFSILALDNLGVPGPQTLALSIVVFSGVVLWGLNSPCKGAVAVRMSQSEMSLVRFCICGFFATCVFVMSTFSPENQISTGLHQEFGDCKSKNLDMMGYERVQYICEDSYPSTWSIDCPMESSFQSAEGRWMRKRPSGTPDDLDHWYTICGKAHASTAEYLLYVCVVVSLAAIGSSLYLWAFSGPDQVAASVPRNPSKGRAVPTMRYDASDNAPAKQVAKGVGRDGRNADRVAEKTNKTDLTPTGEYLRSVFDPIFCPLADNHWVLLSLILTAGPIAITFVLGSLLSSVFKAGTPGTALQVPYDMVQSLGFGYAGHPLFTGMFAMGSYVVLTAIYTAMDFWRPEFIQKIMIQPRPAGEFGGEGLGLVRCLKTQAQFAFFVMPIYMAQYATAAPVMYQEPWMTPCFFECTEENLKTPSAPPSVVEFLVHMFFCVVVMDASYWYYHWMCHRHRGLYRNIHALHHEYRAPFALVTQHAHPLELLATGAFSVTAPVACSAHPFTMWCWVFTSILISVEAHSGYEAPLGLDVISFGLFGGTIHHDVHHQSPWCNFQPFMGYLDKLCGTTAKAEDARPSADREKVLRAS